MEKKRFGPKLTMDSLSKASKAKVKFLSLPREIETPFDTGHGPNKNLKWEMDLVLLEHPTQEVLGEMVWQTTASVIRIEIVNIIHNATEKSKDKFLEDLKSCEWWIMCNAKGQISIKEV
tara:strand:- start:740 stop:1096 length:357 start_codon:yes stop_codon:yes gene_type:complete